MNDYLKKAANWFVTVKAPDLEEKVNTALLTISKGEGINDNYKKLLGFILFDYSMHHGPTTFFAAEKVAEEIGVIEELKHYANDWIQYSKKKQAAEK